MRENGKNSVIIIGACVSVLVVIFCIWSAASRVFAQTRSGSHETKEQAITETFDSVRVNEVSADVILKEAADGQAKVEYCDTGSITHEIDVSSHTLTVTAKTRKSGWLSGLFAWMFSMDASRKERTVLYLPQSSLEELTVNTVSGDVEIPEGMNFDHVSVNTVSGDVSVSGSHVSGEAGFETVSGDAAVAGISAGTLHIQTVSGEVAVKDARVPGDVKISTVSGDVKGNIEGSHSYSVHTLSGEKEYPEQMSGGARVSVETTSGDVKLQ